ncbi:MAG: DUF4352 domain-containing protein [Spirochaetes bacterium]|nr:DUF4352 domain-containing protein [Spirochaetota bacterium]
MNEVKATLADAHYIAQPGDGEPRLFLVLDFSIENRGRETMMVYESSEVRLRDGKGYAFEPVRLQKTKGDLGNKVIPGDRNRGEVAFLISDGAKGLRALFDFSEVGYKVAAGWTLPERSPSNTASLGAEQLQEAPRSVYKDVYYLRRKLTSAFGKNEISEARELAYRVLSTSNTLLEKGTLVDHGNEGLFEQWNAMGKLAVSAEYRKGRPEKWVLYDYYPNAALKSSVPWVKGARHGLEIQYFETGTNKMKWVPWAKGLRAGENKLFWPSGKVRAVWNTREGRLHGAAAFYGENGVLQRSYAFKDDKVTEPVKTFDAQGKAAAPERFQPESDPYYKLLAPQ